MSKACTIREGVLLGIRKAGRPLSRPELAMFSFAHSKPKRAALQGELDAMVAAGDLVVIGQTVPKYVLDQGPYPIYAIRQGR